MSDNLSAVKTEDRAHPRQWKYSSPSASGLHTVISPENSACKVTWAFRLNLAKGESYELYNSELELNAGIIAGELRIRCTQPAADARLGRMDSFYVPAGTAVSVEALADSVSYIGGGPYEGVGAFFVRRFDPNLSPGPVRQIHGEAPYQREIFMTLNQEVPASRMINGFTWGADGMWTSWPPHQHTVDLEEVYCYFDLPSPKFALHLSSRYPAMVEAVHPVSSGDFVAIPEGYHPTVSMPGTRSSYFWIMVAHRASSRSYELAKSDFGV